MKASIFKPANAMRIFDSMLRSGIDLDLALAVQQDLRQGREDQAAVQRRQQALQLMAKGKMLAVGL